MFLSCTLMSEMFSVLVTHFIVFLGAIRSHLRSLTPPMTRAASSLLHGLWFTAGTCISSEHLTTGVLSSGLLCAPLLRHMEHTGLVSIGGLPPLVDILVPPGFV